MKRLTFAIALAGLVLVAGRSPSQTKLPVYDPNADNTAIKNVAFEDAAGQKNFRHGQLLQVTMNNKDTIRGTLVRTDPKTNQLYIRTQPRSAPVAVAQKDIQKIEKGVRTGEGGIRPAGFEQEVVLPEIHQLVVMNGPVKNVQYYDFSLSQSERSLLRELEEAENEFAQLDYLNKQRIQLLENEMAILVERKRTHELVNGLLEQRLTNNPFAPHEADNNNVVFLKHDQPAVGGVLAQTTLETQVKTRNALKTLQGRAVFEDGRIVAVVAE